MINAINIALSGLTASSKKVDTVASNIANVSTAGSLEPTDGQQAPYSALTTTQQSLENGGVRADIVTRDPGFVPAFDPDSPFANEEGLIGVPNVDLAEEAVNLKLAELTYKANLQTLKVADELSEELFNVLDEDA